MRQTKKQVYTGLNTGTGTAEKTSALAFGSEFSRFQETNRSQEVTFLYTNNHSTI